MIARALAQSGALPIGPAREPAHELLATAESLKIPWERILRDEIQAEQALLRHVRVADSEVPLSTALALLPASFLKSWRVRDQIQSLSCEARGAGFRSAIRELRAVFRRLIGQPDAGGVVFCGHLWVAYQRVLLLQRVCRAARKSSGTDAERLAFICDKTRCTFEDATWALCLEDSPRPGHRLDAAVRKVRGEGFEMPRAATETRAFAKLRRIVRTYPRPWPSAARRPSVDRASMPTRVELPPDCL